MTLSPASLFEHRLLFFTGKGGVGKTTVSLATAMAAAESKRNVLLLLLSPTPWVEALFGGSRFSYTPRSVYPGLDIAEIDSKEALCDYFTREIDRKRTR